MWIYYITSTALSFDTKIAHPNIADMAAKLYNENSETKLSAEEIQWIRQGAEEEDTPTRWFNHFYDPVHNKGIWFGKQHLTALAWSDNSYEQANFSLGDQTWKRALYSYQNGNKKEAFIALGHTLHLIADMAVPAHTRLDSHPSGDSFEQYVKHNWATIQKQIEGKAKMKAVYNLSQVFDVLAGFSNGYFYSDDSIEDKNYQIIKINDFKYINYLGGDYKFYFNTFGTTKYYLYFDKSIYTWQNILNNTKKDNGYSVNHDFILSNYSTILIPQAIGYSAGVIKLFFTEASGKTIDRSEFSRTQKTGLGFANEILAEAVSWGIDNLNAIKTQSAMGEAASDLNSGQTTSVVTTQPIKIAMPAPPPLTSTLPKHISSPVSSGSSAPAPSQSSSNSNFSTTPVTSSLLNQNNSSGLANHQNTSENSSIVGTPTTTTESSSTTISESTTSLSEISTTTLVTVTTTTATSTSSTISASTIITTVTTTPEVPTSTTETTPTTTPEFVTTTLETATTTPETVSTSTISSTTANPILTSTSEISSSTLDIVTTTPNIIPTTTPETSTTTTAIVTSTTPVDSFSGPGTGEVIVNEIAWAGTSAQWDQDEWIELYNNTDADISLPSINPAPRWKIMVGDFEAMPSKIADAIIPAHGYYLMERGSDDTIKNVTANTTFSLNGGLKNTGAKIRLIKPDGTLSDEVDCSNGWFKGDNVEYRTMERIDPKKSGNDPDNWQTNKGPHVDPRTRNGGQIFGSPKVPNFGNISLNTVQQPGTIVTLTKADGPYVLGQYDIKDGAILNIESGVVVKSNYNGANFRVQNGGALNIKGTAEEPVRFTSGRDLSDGVVTDEKLPDGDPTMGDWQGIWFWPGSIGNIDYIDMRYAGHKYFPRHDLFATAKSEGIRSDSASVTVNNSHFLHDGEVFIRSVDNSNLSVQNSIFDDGVQAIYHSGFATPTLENNQYISFSDPDPVLVIVVK